MSAKYEFTTDGSAAEVISPAFMSPENSYLQVSMTAYNSAGQVISFPAASVQFYISEYQDKDAWILVPRNDYYGLACRMKVKKLQALPSVSKLVITIIRSIQPSPVIYTQLYRERISRQGSMFTASRRVTDVPANSNVDSLFVTGSKQIVLNSRIIGYTGKGVVASIYRGATYTGGTAADVQNPNDVDPATATATLLTGATITDIGQLTVAPSYSEGNSSNQGQGNSQAVLGENIIMQANTAYLLRITSLDSSTQNVNAFISWIEDDKYLG